MRNSAGDGLYYGWYIVLLAFIANFMSVGTGFYVFNAFMEPLCETHQWTRTQVNIALVIGTPFGFFGQFVFGTLVMRIGVKKLMVPGALLGGLAFILMFRVSSLGLFYLFYILLFIGNGAYGGIVANSAVSNWFVNKRGRALGIATAGMSLAGAILPLAAMMMIFHLGMQMASLVLGLMVMLFAPLAWLVVVDWPEQMGLSPDGGSAHKETTAPEGSFETVPVAPASPGLVPAGKPAGQEDAAAAAAAVEDPPWTLSRLVRVAAFWKLGLAYAMVMIGVVGVMSQLKPRFVDVGFADTPAMLLMAVTALFGAAGKYFWGLLCDRMDPLKVAAMLMVANAVGLTAAMFTDSMTAVIVFITVFGFAMGGVMATYPVVVADLFGRKSFSSVFRFLAVFLIIQMAGFLIAGLSFDRTGSYDTAYMLFIVLDVIAAMVVLTVKRPGGVGPGQPIEKN